MSLLSGIHVQYIVSHDLFVDGMFFLLVDIPQSAGGKSTLWVFLQWGVRQHRVWVAHFFLSKKCLCLKLKFNEDIHRHIDSRYLQHSSPVVTQTDMVAFWNLKFLHRPGNTISPRPRHRCVCVGVCHVWHRKCCVNKTPSILTTCVHASVKSIFTRDITDNSKTNPIPAALICRRVRSWCSVPRKFSGWCKFIRHAYLWKFGSLNHGPNHTRTLVVMNPVHLVTILSWLASNVPLVGQNEALDVVSWLKPMLFHLCWKD